MSEKKDILWRAYLLYFGFVVLMLVVIFQTINIQLQNEPDNRLTDSDSGRLPTRTVKRKSRRGQILDANYTPLVTSVSYFDIYMDPTVVPKDVFARDLDDLCIELARMYPDKSANEYQRMIREARENGRKYLKIREEVTNEERKKIRELPIFNLGRFKGGLIDNKEKIERVLPHGELLRRTLGSVKWREDLGRWQKIGIEGAFDDYLKGEPGEEVQQLLATGWKNLGLVTKEPVEGASIVTTFDMTIQEVAHNELLHQLETQQAEQGCVIVMDVKTGQVKAMVNLRKNESGNYNEGYNQAVGIKEVPGSTFKLATLMALLEDNKVTIRDKVNATGRYEFFGRHIDDSNNGYGYGEITIQEAFEKSSNVFMRIAYNAYRRNPEQFIRRLKSFGLADPLGISIEGEPTPTLHEPGQSQWSGISLPWMAIGYEYQQTPLQTLAFYNAVANNGKMMRPQFVKEIYRGNQLEKKFEPEVMIDQICSQSTLNDLKKCLEGVMTRGTGKSINSDFFKIAGKTGTAQILDNKTTIEDEKKYQASFVGYFPADAPMYTCIVVVSAPNKDIYGAVVSGSVFNAIANKVYATNLKYHEPINSGKKKKGVLPISADGRSFDLLRCYDFFNIPYKMTEESDWVFTETGTDRVKMMRRFVGKTTVPNVVGMTATDAVYLIERAGMKTKISGYGTVKTQSLKAGEPAVVGRVMEIKLN